MLEGLFLYLLSAVAFTVIVVAVVVSARECEHPALKALLPNLLIFAALSAVVLEIFVFFAGDDNAVIVGGIAGLVVGFFATVGRALITAPAEPTVEVPISVLERMAGVTRDVEPAGTRMKWNAIAVAFLAVLIVGMLADAYWSTAPEIVATAGAAVVAWFAGAGRDLVIRPPEQMVEVPVSTLTALSDRGRSSS